MVSTATARADMNPSPRVDLLIDAAQLTAGTVTGTVYQLSKWGQVPVRGAIKVATAGGFAVTDYEVPLGTPITYRIEQFNVSGASLGFALNLTAQLDIATSWAVVSDPLAPGNAIMLRAEKGFADVLTRSRPTALYRAGLDTIALSGVRSPFKDINLRCWTEDEDERELFDAIVGESLILVRTMPEMRLPGALYAVIPDTGRAHLDDDSDMWELTGQEVTRPTLDVLVPVYDWQDVVNYWPTWTAVIAARATWLELIRTPPPSA